MFLVSSFIKSKCELINQKLDRKQFYFDPIPYQVNILQVVLKMYTWQIIVFDQPNWITNMKFFNMGGIWWPLFSGAEHTQNLVEMHFLPFSINMTEIYTLM